MTSFALLSVAMLSDRRPQPLMLKDEVQEWAELVYYDERGPGAIDARASLRRNLSVEFRKVASGRNEVTVKELARDTGLPLPWTGQPDRAKADAACLDRMKKYIEALPKKRTTDEWGLSAPSFMNEKMYPSAFWGFFIPRKLSRGQTTWTESLQPPFHIRNAVPALLPVTYSFNDPLHRRQDEPDVDRYAFACDQRVEPPFHDEDYSATFRLEGVCCVDSKLRKLTYASMKVSWSYRSNVPGSRESTGRSLKISHQLMRGNYHGL